MTGDVKGVIVHDASCLIDLSKGKLLRFVPKLPFRLIVPFPIRHSEVLDFTDREWRLLDEGGLETASAGQWAGGFAAGKSGVADGLGGLFILLSSI